MTANDSAALWNSVAAGWERGYDWYSMNVRPLAAWVCDHVARPSAKVLDVACGSGQPALAIAARVSPGGSVVATDVSTAMLDATQRTAEKLGIHNIELVEMDAENLRFPRSSFDAVTCCCGLPFCQDPIQALREMRRVMVPGGRIALSVWDAPEKNPFFTTIGDVIATLVEPSARPEQRRAWPFSHADELSRAFRAAGFAEFDVESRALTFEVDSVDDYWRLFVDFAAGVASKLAAVPAARVESARNELGAAAETFRDGSRLRFPASALCVSGAR